MRLFLQLGLSAALTSAIDIGIFDGFGCGGASRAFCTAVNPNSCCGLPGGGYASIGFYGIPTDWNLNVRGHTGGNCGTVSTSDTTFGTNFKCLSSGPYTGAGYSFRSSKRDTGVGHARSTGECKTPDVFYTAEGKKFSLVDLDDNQTAEFLEHGFRGIILEKYQKYEVTM